MRNQSVKNPKVFPASTATLEDTLRCCACVRTAAAEKDEVGDKTHALWIRLSHTSRLARSPSDRDAYRLFLPAPRTHEHTRAHRWTYTHSHIHARLLGATNAPTRFHHS
jgi:hypothetical protein